MLKVQCFKLVHLRLVLADLLPVHPLHSLAKLSQCWLFQWDLLATVPLLLLKVDRLLCRGTLIINTAHDISQSALLHQILSNSASHGDLLGHGRVCLELVMDVLDYGSEAGALPVPVLNRRSLIFDGHGVE